MSKKNKIIKAVAFSQIFIMFLEIFSFAFIMAMMFSGIGNVSAIEVEFGKRGTTIHYGDTFTFEGKKYGYYGDMSNKDPTKNEIYFADDTWSDPAVISAYMQARPQHFFIDTSSEWGSTVDYTPGTTPTTSSLSADDINTDKYLKSQTLENTKLTGESPSYSTGTPAAYVPPPAAVKGVNNKLPVNYKYWSNIYEIKSADGKTTNDYKVIGGEVYDFTGGVQGAKVTDEGIRTDVLKSEADQYAQKKEFKFPGIDKGVELTPNSGAGIGWAGMYLMQGFVYAGAVWAFTQGISGLLPDSAKTFVKPAGQALAAGIVTYNTIYGLTTADYGSKGTAGNPNNGGLLQESTAMWTAGIIAAIVTYMTLAEQYKKTKTKEVTVNFKCYQWQAPNGGSECTKCNEDKQMPCSEYRCKSLGQTCKLLNAGSSSPMCIDGSRNDVTSPGIKPDKKILSAGLTYTAVTERPPGGNGPAGMTITGTADGGCIPAFTPFEFGIITTDNGDNGVVEQPAQCKIEYNHTNDFDNMGYYMSDNNLYLINHAQVMMLPGTDLLNTAYAESNGTLQVKNDGNYNLYIRCKDGNGNKNKDEFNVRFCIDKTPDSQAPIVKATNINTGSGVKYQADNVSIEVYTNEPSSCRWSRKDSGYTNMEYNMSCSNKIWEVNSEMLYTCATTLTGIKDREENNFYFRCQDLKQNVMQQSYEFTLRGSQPLTLLKVGPSGIVSGATSTVTTNLEASTDNGLDNGIATCYYSTTSDKLGIEFVNTKAVTHTQPLDLTNGDYTYYITCIDAAGNSASNSTKFKIYVDKDAPVVLRAYTYESKLTLVTNEDATCRYSNIDCNFNLAKLEGTAMPYDGSRNHYSEFETSKTYYVKCKDSHDNQPDSSQCSFVVRPFSLTVA